MRILVNCSTLKKGGVLQVAHSFIGELIKRSDHDYHVIFSSALKKDFQIKNIANNITVYTHDVRPSVFLSLTGKEKYLSNLEAKIKPDIVFSVFGPTYWKPKCLHLCGYAKASYFYPDSPYIKNMPLYPKLVLNFKKQLHLYDFTNFNHALVTETTDATQRLKKILPSKRVFTVSNTYNQIFDNPGAWKTNIALSDFNGVTLLSITANYKHKNLTIIPEVIKYLSEKYPTFQYRFILTLTGDEINFMEANYRKHIVFLGKVSIYACPHLYSQSDLMFMPTLLECFSATYPEAMKMGVPILTSDLPFAKSICGDAAVYFDPLSPQSVGEAIYSLATNDSLRKEYIRRGKKRLLTFETAKTRAQKYIEILEKLYETNHSKS